MVATSKNQLETINNYYHSLVIGSPAQISQHNVLYRYLDEFKNMVGDLIDTMVFLYARNNIFASFSINLLDNPSVRSYLLNYIYRKELAAIDIIITQEYIKSSSIDGIAEVFKKSPFEWSKQDFRKIYLVTHPDKGGVANDFRVVQEFERQIRFQEASNNNLNMKAFEKLLHSMQEFISRTSISFKLFDTVTDVVRFIYEPSVNHAKSMVLDTTYLYSMYKGVNGYFLCLNMADILYDLYQGKYTQVMHDAVTMAAYMALPSALNYIQIPYINLFYSVAMAGYSGYIAISNAYSFYIEYDSYNFNLKSYTAYKDVSEVLFNTPLQQFYDFAAISKRYEVNINTISLEIEKAKIKQQLKTKGEFGNKLYDYIYMSILEEKYTLLNKITKGELTKEQAEVLKAQHVSIILENQYYQHCMEIVKLKEKEIEHYYCYNEEQQILDHVLIDKRGEYAEAIERF